MKFDEMTYNEFEKQTQNIAEAIFELQLHRGSPLEYNIQKGNDDPDKEIIFFIGRYLKDREVLVESLNYHLVSERVKSFLNAQVLDDGKTANKSQGDKDKFLKDISYIDEFISAELDEANNHWGIEGVDDYRQHLKEIESKKSYIKAMINNSFTREIAVDFKTFAEGKLESNTIDLDTMESDITELFRKADQLFFKRCLGLAFNDDRIEKYLNYFFDFNAYKRPAILEQYPHQLRQYKLMLKAWLLKEIHKRIKNIGLDSLNLEKEYSIIKEFAENLLDPAEKKYLDNNQTPIGDYPNHIFNDYRGYALFRQYIKHAFTKNSELNFLYYHMKDRENEEEFQIKAPPVDFKLWYFKDEESNDEFDLKNDHRAKTDERLSYYNLIKNLIKKLYENA